MEIKYLVNIKYRSGKEEQTTTIIDLEDLEKSQDIYELLYENLNDCEESCDRAYTFHCDCEGIIENIKIIERKINYFN